MLPTRLPKLALAARPLNQAYRLGAVRCMSAWPSLNEQKALIKNMKASMDDLPVPTMKWEDGYKKYNVRWNIELAISTTLCVIFLIKMFYANELLCYPLADLDEFEKWRKAKRAAAADAE